MDSDCLIKLVKAALKETVCLNFTVVIPALVKREVVEEGRRQPDAAIVEDNLKRKLLLESKGSASPAKGEEEVFSAFQSGKYDAICSDDRRLLRRLRLLGIPYMTPGVLIAVLVKDGKLTVQQALEKLESLSPMISDEESSAVRLFLSNWSQQ
jgi:rRNA-processing protein FCF1